MYKLMTKISFSYTLVFMTLLKKKKKKKKKWQEFGLDAAWSCYPVVLV